MKPEPKQQDSKDFFSQKMNSYSSIQYVLEKINRDGSFDKIYSFFHILFLQEQKFAYQHIVGQCKKQSHEELKSQLVSNLSIFKDNIEIIVRDVIDKVWQDFKMEIHEKSSCQFMELQVDKIDEMDEEQDSTKRSLINPENSHHLERLKLKEKLNMEFLSDQNSNCFSKSNLENKEKKRPQKMHRTQSSQLCDKP